MIDFSKQATCSLALLGAIGMAGPALADGGAAHQGNVRPLQLGVSGGSIEHVIDKAFAYCYAGTLGSLVTDGGAQYILSNNHVLAKENEPDNALAPDGRQIIQQGLLDEAPGSCTLGLGDPGHVVAYLTDYVPILFGKGKNLPENRVDAAIADMGGYGSSDGTIMDVGKLTSPDPVDVIAGDRVQKSGRTTGHTFGEVAATNVTIKVGYTAGTALFLEQIEVVGLCGTLFSDSGDSGSLVVNLPDGSSPRGAAGLLFAGGGGSTFANPVAVVLAELEQDAVTPLYMVSDGTGNVDDVTGNADIPTCTGGGGGSDGGGGPPPDRGGGKFRNAADPVGLEIAAQVAADHSADLLALPGVVGHGIGVNRDGEPVIRIYVEQSRRPAGQSIPDNIGGFGTKVVVTGPIVAY